VAWVTSFSGYLSHRLTGEFKDNIANYFGQWPVDYKTWSWSDDDEVVKKFNIPRRMLFDVCPEQFWVISPIRSLAPGFPWDYP
jgi:sugar (pentulose or hexulose) kinase